MQLIDNIMENIKATLLTAKTKAEYSGESLELHKEPKRLKLINTKTSNPTKLTSPMFSIMLARSL